MKGELTLVLSTKANNVQRRVSGSRTGSGVENTENMNPEDVHKSLRSTANAIQNYAFESSPKIGQSSPGMASLEEKMSLLDMSDRKIKMFSSKNGDDVLRNNVENASKGKKKIYGPFPLDHIF